MKSYVRTMINPLGSDHLVMTDHLDTPPQLITYLIT